MRTSLEIETTPVNEPCAQVGEEGYGIRARAEARALIEQIQRQYEVPEGVVLRIKSCNHDFGTYYEIGVHFDDDVAEQADFAYRLESQGPDYWDPVAKAQLSITE